MAVNTHATNHKSQQQQSNNTSYCKLTSRPLPKRRLYCPTMSLVHDKVDLHVGTTIDQLLEGAEKIWNVRELCLRHTALRLSLIHI